MGKQPAHAHRGLALVRRSPATLALRAVVIAVGVAWQGLWSPFREAELFDTAAYGLPALEAGRWWTPVTGTFFVDRPLTYVFTLASFAGMAYLEYRRGSRIALSYFAIGQMFAVLRSGERRVGIECVSTCGSWGPADH